MPATSRTGLRRVQRRRPASLRRHPVQRPCHKHHFALSVLQVSPLPPLEVDVERPAGTGNQAEA